MKLKLDITPDLVAAMAAEIAAGEKAVTTAMREAGTGLNLEMNQILHARSGASVTRHLTRDAVGSPGPSASPTPLAGQGRSHSRDLGARGCSTSPILRAKAMVARYLLRRRVTASSGNACGACWTLGGFRGADHALNWLDRLSTSAAVVLYRNLAR